MQGSQAQPFEVVARLVRSYRSLDDALTDYAEKGSGLPFPSPKEGARADRHRAAVLARCVLDRSPERYAGAILDFIDFCASVRPPNLAEEIRTIVPPLIEAYKNPAHFFQVVAPRLDPRGFDPVLIEPPIYPEERAFDEWALEGLLENQGPVYVGKGSIGDPRSAKRLDPLIKESFIYGLTDPTFFQEKWELAVTFANWGSAVLLNDSVKTAFLRASPRLQNIALDCAENRSYRRSEGRPALRRAQVLHLRATGKVATRPNVSQAEELGIPRAAAARLKVTRRQMTALEIAAKLKMTEPAVLKHFEREAADPKRKDR